MLNPDQIALTLTQPWIMSVFVGVILSIALIPLYQAIFSIRAVNADLRTATQVLKSLGGGKLQEEFFTQFKNINKQISKISGLRHAWREFAYSMYFESAPAYRKVYLSHRPSYYFNRDSVLGTRLNLGQFFAFPNYLIGIGLTLTFIGLAAALHVAQAGMASGAGQEALKQLLAVAAVKFVSSIAGLSSSLAVSAIQRIRLRDFQTRLQEFCEMLEECTEYKSTEKLLHDNIHEQRKHSLMLGEMPGSIAASIGDALGKHVAASVSQSLQPVTQDMKQLAEKFTGACEDALRKMLEEFLSKLRQSTAEDMQGLIENAATLRQSLEGLSASMTEAGRKLGESISEPTEKLSGLVSGLSTAFAPVQQAVGQWSESSAALTAAAGKIEQAGSQISKAAESNQHSATEFEKTIGQITGSLAPLGTQLASVSQALGKIEQAAGELKDAGGSISQAAGGIAQAASGFKADAELGQMLAELSKGNEQFRSGVQSLAKLIDEQFSSALSGLNRAIEELKIISQSEKKQLRGSRFKSLWGK